MLKHIKRHVLSLEEHLDVTTNPELAEANAAEITEGQERNEEILQAKTDNLANATAQAEDPFNPDVVTVEPTSEEDAGDDTEVDDVTDELLDTDNVDSDSTSEDDTAESTEEDAIETEEGLDDVNETEESGSDDEDTTETSDEDVLEDGSEEDNSEESEGLDEELEESDSDDEASDDGEELDDDEVEIEDIDLATTEEDVEESEEEAEEAEEEAEEIEEEIVDDSKTLDELDSESESLESYIGLLKEGIRTGAKDPLFMAAVDIKLQRLKSALGPLAPRTPSLEHYDVAEASEYYSFALEAAEGFLGRIKSLGASLSKTLDTKYQAMLVKRTSPRNAALNKKADLLIAKLASIKDNPTITMKVRGFRTRESSLSKAITIDIKNLTLLSGERLPKVNDIYSEVVSIFQAIKSNGGPGKTGKIAKRGFKVKPLAFDEFAEPGCFITGHHLTEVESKGDGDDDMQRLRILFSGLVPELELAKVKDSVDSFSVNKTELLRLVTLTKAYIALSNKTLNSVGAKVTEIQTKLRQDLVAILDEDFTRFGIDDSNLDKDGWKELVIPHGIVAGVTEMTKHYVRLYNFTVVHGSEVAEMLLYAIDSAVKRME